MAAIHQLRQSNSQTPSPKQGMDGMHFAHVSVMSQLDLIHFRKTPDMTRHSQNLNLSLYSDSHYAGLPVQSTQGPLIEQYLARIHQVMARALDQHPRTFAFRCDLRFPVNYIGAEMDSNQVIERFMASFKSKTRHNRHIARQTNPYAHDSAVRYVWCREYGQHGMVHYHCVFFLNNDAFCALGKFELGRNNLFNRLHEAWASALGMAVKDVDGLVHLPRDACCLLQSDNPAALHDYFHRVSYLAKAHSKHYAFGVHALGSSRG